MIRASLYCSTFFMGLQDEGAARCSLSILCSGPSLASAQDGIQPPVSLKLPWFLTSVKQQKDTTDTNIIHIFSQIYRNITVLSFLTAGK